MSNNKTLCQIKRLETHITQHNFNFKKNHKEQHTKGGMPHPKHTDLDMTKHWQHSDYFQNF